MPTKDQAGCCWGLLKISLQYALFFPIFENNTLMLAQMVYDIVYEFVDSSDFSNST